MRDWMDWIGCSRPEFSQGHDRTESIGYGYGGRHGARSEGTEIDSSSIEGNQSPLSHPVRMNQKDVQQKEKKKQTSLFFNNQSSAHCTHPAKQQFYQLTHSINNNICAYKHLKRRNIQRKRKK